LGLAGYYRKYIRDFGLIAVPLTHLLRCDAFSWDEEATTAFAALKWALTTGPVLQMLDFDMPFVVDCDASDIGFGAVVHQGEGPLAFFSRPFAARHHKLAAYERELIGLVQAVRHWRPYLWGQSFRVRIDHYSLKFLLDQRLSTAPQHQWISKLFGFDFTVEYHPGRLNTASTSLRMSRTTLPRQALSCASTPGCPSPSSTTFAGQLLLPRTHRRFAGALTPASWERPGAWTVGYFYTGATFSCPTIVTCATRSCPWHTLHDTRACRRPSIASVLISTSPVMARWSVTGCGHA
jgi:hypothetical protein